MVVDMRAVLCRFEGVVTEYNQGVHRIEYDDGSVCLEDLSMRHWKPLGQLVHKLPLGSK